MGAYKQFLSSDVVITPFEVNKSFNFQETSQRYCDPLNLLEEEETCWDFDLRKQDPKNRQNSINNVDVEVAAKFKQRIFDYFHEGKKLYTDMLEEGIAKECARNILLMCSPTKIHITGSVRSFIHYVGLRASIETQKEHRLIATAIGNKLSPILPTTIEAVKVSAQNDHSLRGWFNVTYR